MSRTFGPFAALDLAFLATEPPGRDLGATIWIVARIVYLPLYLAGVALRRAPRLWVISVVASWRCW